MTTKKTLEQKRKEKDDLIRAKMQERQEMRERLKFSRYSRKYVDITICDKKFFIENANELPDNVEVWVFNKKERAFEAAIILRTNDFKIRI